MANVFRGSGRTKKGCVYPTLRQLQEYGQSGIETFSSAKHNVEVILANLSGGSTFSKLDLAYYYNQLELRRKIKEVLGKKTHKGLFQQNRLVFGITAAPTIWQNALEGVMQGLPGVQIYLDDILITGQTQDEHMNNLDVVLTGLKERGVRLKKEKCKFVRDSVEFLGHRTDVQGTHKLEKRVNQI